MSQIMAAGGGGALVPANFANSPSPSVSLTAVPGTAITAKRSDEILSLDQTAAYAFSGLGATTISQQGASASALTLTGGTVTTSQPLINATQTWNAGAVAFTGLKSNITNTASAAGSLLLDLQVGGNSKFNIRVDGQQNTNLQGFALWNNATALSGTNKIAVYADAGGIGHFLFSSDSQLEWNNNVSNLAGSTDLIVGRAAAATLRLGAANAASPVAQTLKVQDALTGNNNGAATFTIQGSASVGNGTSGDIVFQTGKNGNGSGVLATQTVALTIKGETQAVVIAAGKTLQLGATAVTGLVAGALAALTNASLTLTDSTGTVYRIPCVTP